MQSQVKSCRLLLLPPPAKVNCPSAGTRPRSWNHWLSCDGGEAMSRYDGHCAGLPSWLVFMRTGKLLQTIVWVVRLRGALEAPRREYARPGFGGQVSCEWEWGRSQSLSRVDGAGGKKFDFPVVSFGQTRSPAQHSISKQGQLARFLFLTACNFLLAAAWFAGCCCVVRRFFPETKTTANEPASKSTSCVLLSCHLARTSPAHVCSRSRWESIMCSTCRS
jgi:hypothetical protein